MPPAARRAKISYRPKRIVVGPMLAKPSALVRDAVLFHELLEVLLHDAGLVRGLAHVVAVLGEERANVHAFEMIDDALACLLVRQGGVDLLTAARGRDAARPRAADVVV